MSQWLLLKASAFGALLLPQSTLCEIFETGICPIDSTEEVIKNRFGEDIPESLEGAKVFFLT